MAAEQQTIIIFRTGSLGDTVVALPCFHRIAISYPDARRVLLTNTPVSSKAAPSESVLGDSGLIDGVIHFPPPPRHWRDFVRLAAQIRQTRAKTLIFVGGREPLGALRDAAFFWACGVRRIIGLPLASDLRRLRRDPATGDTEREAERLARCLAELGPIDLKEAGMWDLRLGPEEVAAADAALAPLKGRDFIAMNVGGKVAQKDWGDENWIATLDLLSGALRETALVFFGAEDEAHRAVGLANRWPGATLNFCGQLTPRQSAAVMRKALVFVGHDSGPLHLAAAMGVACVGVYGDYNMPKTWHPFGDQHRIIHNLRGVGDISSAQVAAAVTSVIVALRQASDSLTGNKSAF